MWRTILVTLSEATVTVSVHDGVYAGMSTAQGAAGGTVPFSPFEWMIAGRYLCASRGDGIVSVVAGFSFLGVMLGVAALIIVMAVMNGFRHDLFSKIMGLNGHVIVQKIGDRFADYDAIADRIRNIPGVKTAIPVIEGQIMVSSSMQALGGLVRGLRESDLKSLKLVSGNMRAGTLDGFDKQRGIAMGARLANQLRVGFGDAVTLVSPHGASTPFGTAPRSKAYRVTSIFELGMSEYDRMMIFMPLSEAQKYFSKNGEADVVEVVVDNPEDIDRYDNLIKAVGGPAIGVNDWRQRNETFFNVLSVERSVMFIILSLIVLVAALNIISGLTMLVKDKSRDIAILRTMGATKGAVMRIFLITGTSIGGVGALAGLVIGVLFCWNIENIKNFASWVSGTVVFDSSVYYLTKLPAEIDFHETGSIVVMALVLSIIATLYPSWKASKLDPVDALRYK